MDRRVFAKWLSERCIFASLKNRHENVLFADNTTGRTMMNEVKEALSKSNTKLSYLLNNFVQICQPADAFLIQNIKAAWRARWNAKWMNMITKDECVN